MRRRIKPRVAWLPRDPGVTIVQPGGVGASNVIGLELNVLGTGGTATTGVVPVVLDQTHFPDGSGFVNSLSDIENSGYRLRRIVGKCFVALNQVDSQEAGQEQAEVACVSAGFIVLRTDTGGTPAQGLDQYNPLSIDNDDSPWIWKREWLLQNGIARDEAVVQPLDYPFTNTEYGSVADGPHIDQKTARIIGKDERLFFVATLMILRTGGPPEASVEATATIHLIPRVLGSMRATLGNRNNASR